MGGSRKPHSYFTAKGTVRGRPMKTLQVETPDGTKTVYSQYGPMGIKRKPKK